MNNKFDMDYSIQARFGKIISEQKWGVVPFAIYKLQRELGLRIHDVWFLVWLIMHKWNEENPFPSIAKMSRMTGYSESYIRGISTDLQERGFLDVVQRFREDGGQNTNIYFLEPLLKKIETIIDSKKPKKFQVALEAQEFQFDSGDEDLFNELEPTDYEEFKLEDDKHIYDASLERQMMIDEAERNFLARVAMHQEQNEDDEDF